MKQGCNAKCGLCRPIGYVAASNGGIPTSKENLMNFRILILFALSACVPPPPIIIQQPSPDESKTAESADIPYPAPDLQQQIDELGIEIARLQELTHKLQTRVQLLERNAADNRRPILPNGSPHLADAPQPADGKAANLTAARNLYRNGNYAAAAKLLGSSEGGGNGNAADRDSMYLLMLSHKKLGNCESVINIGNRYVSRFRNSPDAAAALFEVGACQWRMQQKDVARDTWRKLMRAYPDSPAAEKAAHEIKKR